MIEVYLFITCIAHSHTYISDSMLFLSLCMTADSVMCQEP